MAVDLTKFCTSNAADGTGYGSPTNFYADDGGYATALPNKNNSLAHYVSGFDFSAIGDDDTLNSVTVYIQFKYSTDTASYTLGSQGYVGATANGSEYTNTNTPTGDTDVNYTIDGLTIADIKSADFKIRIRCSRGNNNTASTQSIDYVKVTVNYTAVVVATGTLSKTLDNTSLSASGKAIISGSLSKSIDVISISAAGEVSGESEPEEVTGVLDKTIDSVSLSSSGKVTVQGAVGKTLDGATLSSAGKVIVNGALSKSLDSVVVASAGKTFIAGELSKALDGTQIQSAGKVFISGALETNIDAIALNAVGRVDDEEPTITEGALSVSLEPVSISAAGKIIIQGSASTETSVSMQSAGGVAVSGSLSANLDGVTLNASGSGQAVVVGSLSVGMDDLSLTTQGKTIIQGALNKSLDGVQLSAQGELTPIITGQAAISLDDVEFQSAGLVLDLPIIYGALSTVLAGVSLAAFNYQGKGAIQAGERGSAIADSRAVMGAKANGVLSGHRKVIEVKHGN